MGQVLHKRARTTERVRKEIQDSQESVRERVKKYAIGRKTVVKWKSRDYVHDSPMGPREIRSTVLSREEEAVCVAFRKHSLLSLDDCLYVLQERIPHLTRSSLHRLFQRHDISRLADQNSKEREKNPIGYFHGDITNVRTEEGFVAIDRTSKFAYVELLEEANGSQAASFIRNLMKAVPYKIDTILTDNGTQFTNNPTAKHASPHEFDWVCQANGTEHRLTQPGHPWTNGPVERMNKTIKDASVHRYYYTCHDQLRSHLQDFINAYNFAKRLRALKGLTPFEFILHSWRSDLTPFSLSPLAYSAGPDS